MQTKQTTCNTLTQKVLGTKGCEWCLVVSRWLIQQWNNLLENLKLLKLSLCSIKMKSHIKAITRLLYWLFSQQHIQWYLTRGLLAVYAHCTINKTALKRALADSKSWYLKTGDVSGDCVQKPVWSKWSQMLFICLFVCFVSCPWTPLAEASSIEISVRQNKDKVLFLHCTFHLFSSQFSQ